MILDTSVLCCLLQVPGKETCGSDDAFLDFEAVSQKLQEAENKGYLFVLPLASIIETGNHIAHSNRQRYEKAVELGELIKKAADAKSPWTAFTNQSELWDNPALKRLAEIWPEKAAQKISIGDATISEIADYYAGMGYEVVVFSGDKHLSAYTPPKPKRIPRRRQR